MNKTNTSITVINKISFFLAGFLSSLIIIGISLKIINNIYGGIVGMIISLIAAIFIRKNYTKTPAIKTATTGAIASVAIMIILGIIAYITITILFQGIKK